MSIQEQKPHVGEPEDGTWERDYFATQLYQAFQPETPEDEREELEKWAKQTAADEYEKWYGKQ